jgi:hypothetical protein
MSSAVTPRYLLSAFLLSSVALVGCGGEDDRPPVWSYISPAIIQPNCATSSCHSRGTAVAGLDLSSANVGWNGLLRQHLPPLTDEVGKERSKVPRQLVLPYNPNESKMLNMLLARGTNRMPPDRPLADADIALVERWILLGAKND